MEKQKIIMVIILAIFITSIIWIAFSYQPDKDEASIPRDIDAREDFLYNGTTTPY